MDPAKLSVDIGGFSPNEDGKTFQFTINVTYGRLRWSLKKRFSEFARLHSQLESVESLAGLPPLPPKTLIGRPQDVSTVVNRKEALGVYLKRLLRRPDIRTSDSLLKFLDFEAETHAVVRNLAPTCVHSTKVSHYSVSSFAAHIPEKVLFVGHEDASALSRLGRVWQIVEPDEAGYIQVWRYTRSTADWQRLCVQVTPWKVRAVTFYAPGRKLFVGDDKGVIHVYDVPNFDNLDESKSERSAWSFLGLGGSKKLSDFLEKESSQLQAHEGSIVAFCCGVDRMLSLGFDGSIRLICLQRGMILSGGRLGKRLDSTKLTSGFFDEKNSRAFLGTSGGQIIIYSIEDSRPEHLHTFHVGEPAPIKALTQIDNGLLVGYGATVVVLEYPSPGGEKRMARLTSYETPLTSGRTIQSMAAWESRAWLLVGHAEAVAVWSLETGECLSAFKVWNGASGFMVLPPGRNDDGDGGHVILGGGGGAMQLWKIEPKEEFEVWISDEKNSEDGEGGERHARQTTRSPEMTEGVRAEVGRRSVDGDNGDEYSDDDDYYDKYRDNDDAPRSSSSRQNRKGSSRRRDIRGDDVYEDDKEGRMDGRHPGSSRGAREQGGRRPQEKALPLSRSSDEERGEGTWNSARGRQRRGDAYDSEDNNESSEEERRRGMREKRNVTARREGYSSGRRQQPRGRSPSGEREGDRRRVEVPEASSMSSQRRRGNPLMDSDDDDDDHDREINRGRPRSEEKRGAAPKQRQPGRGGGGRRAIPFSKAAGGNEGDSEESDDSDDPNAGDDLHEVLARANFD